MCVKITGASSKGSGASSTGAVFGRWAHHFVLHERIIYHFKNYVSQLKITQYSGLSPSTINSIVKRFRDLPLLNISNFKPLLQYCIRKRHATVTAIGTWAHCGKSLSRNTIKKHIKKCSLKLLYKDQAKHHIAQKCWQVTLGLSTSEKDLRTMFDSTCQR